MQEFSSEEQPSSSDKRLPKVYSTFWPAFWLGVVLFGAKFVRLFGPAYYGYWELKRYLGEVAMVGANDILFALAAGVIGQLALMSCGSRHRLQKWVFRGFLLFSAACVFFGILSMRLYDVLHMPLTYPLLTMGSDVANMRSSITTFLTPGFVALLVGLPIAYLVVAVATDRFLQFKRSWFTRLAQAGGLTAIGAFSLLGHQQIDSAWGQRYHMPKVWENPHYVFARSLIGEAFQHSPPPSIASIPKEYVQEFAPSVAAGTVTPGIRRGPKNVVVVIGESVSAHYLSLYGSKLPTWPVMEAEAAHCMVFNNYYSHIANTSDALFSITLSRYMPLTWRQATVELPRASGTTVAEVLRPRGYRTAFISGGDNSYAKQDQFLAGRGFDLVQDRRDVPIKTDFSWGLDDSLTFGLILKFIDQDRSKPFYVCSWTQGTHHPFRIPPGMEERDYIKGDTSLGDIPLELNRYLNALAELDRQLGRFFDALRKRGLADDTIVVVTGDHGQAFGAPHDGHYHSGNVYQEDVRVPFVIWSPGLFQTGQTSEAVGAHVDLAPTVLDLLGVPPPAGWQGRSLMAPEPTPRRAYFFGMRNDYLFGVREGAYKYIFNSTQGRDELYDLSADPLELSNSAAAHPELRERLRQHVGAWLEADKRYPASGR